MKLTAMI